MSTVMDREPTGASLPVVNPHALPLVEETPRERADAARNRGKVLAAAEELCARPGCAVGAGRAGGVSPPWARVRVHGGDRGRRRRGEGDAVPALRGSRRA